MKKHLIILSAMVVLFMGTKGFAQEKKEPVAGDISSKTAEYQQINAFMVEKIRGSQVINLKGEPIGQIEDLIVDIDTGRIVYAVLESGGFLGFDENLRPVPWKSLAALPSEGMFFLNQTKEQMEKAPSFDKTSLSDMTNMYWGDDIFKYYVAPGDEQPEPMGYNGYGYGFPYGFPFYGGYPMSSNAGSDREDSYKKIFDSNTIKTVSGQVIKVNQVPGPAFGMEMRLAVFTDKKEVLPVYLGPAFYIVSPEQAKPFKIEDKVTVTGSMVTVQGEALMLAVTVKRGSDVLRLRDKNGTPEWFGWTKTSD